MDGVKDVRVEGDEYKICAGAYHSDEIISLPNATNKEVLDYIHNEFSCKFNINEADSGDFVICKRVVKDENRKDRKGTVKQILNQMQSEGGCKVELPKEAMAAGDGGILPIPTEEMFDEDVVTLIDELLFAA